MTMTILVPTRWPPRRRLHRHDRHDAGDRAADSGSTIKKIESWN